MKYATGALAALAISSTAQAKITDLLCTAQNDDRQWSVSLNDETQRATITFLVNGYTSPDQKASFTANQIHIFWGDTITFDIDRTTLRFRVESSYNSSVNTGGLCRIDKHANRQI